MMARTCVKLCKLVWLYDYSCLSVKVMLIELLTLDGKLENFEYSLSNHLKCVVDEGVHTIHHNSLILAAQIRIYIV